jgi:hypothetical protein
MTIGAVILMALDGGGLSQGPWSLYAHNYYASLLDTAHVPYQDWQGIEVFYSGVVSEDLSALVDTDVTGRVRPANFHFVIPVRPIQSRVLDTARWVNQRPCTPGVRFHGASDTLAVCVVADPRTTGPTDAQKQTTKHLIDTLARRFSIAKEQISYPQGW